MISNRTADDGAAWPDFPPIEAYEDQRIVPFKTGKATGAISGQPVDSWKSQLRLRGERFVGDEANVLMALASAPLLRGVCRFNEFKGRVEFARVSCHWRDIRIGDAWLEQDDLDLQSWLQLENVDVRQRGIVADCIERVARRQPYHPVREYLMALDWDGTCRLASFLATYLGAKGSATYLAAVGSKFMISAVARIMRPGVQVDHILVFEGDQGTGKTSAVRALGVHPDWVGDSLPNLHDKDSAIYIQGVWVVELSELAAMRKSDLESTKAFLSRTHDRFRPPYGRRTAEFPRQCVFIATTNEAQYLRDATGNRRFWPVSCGLIHVDALVRDRDQIWAEAVARYAGGEHWHLTGDEVRLACTEQVGRVYVSELEERVAVYLDGLLENGSSETTTHDLLLYCLKLDPCAASFIEMAGRIGPQVAGVLKKCGWHRVGETGRGKRRRVTYRCS